MRYSEKKRRSKKERIGFYTALSICIVAVGMAAYSTYTSLSGVFGDNESESSLAVNNIVTGVMETEKETAPVTETKEKPTETEVKSTETEFIETVPPQTKTALQTMTAVKTSLSYPLDKRKVIKEYSEESVYNKTLNQWQAHTGVDFACDKGDNVYSMGDGEVKRIYNDDMLGKTIIVESSDYTAYYSGFSGNVKVEKGSVVKEGDVLGTAGTVPCEDLEESHIHIAVKVNGQFTDVLSLINNDE